MLKKNNRLQKQRDFQKVFKLSKPVYSGHLYLRAAQNPNSQTLTRFGFIISNKIDKRATRRNFLRRQLRALILDNLSEIKGGLDIIIGIKEAYSGDRVREDIKKDLTCGLSRIGAIK
ncbi:MAG: ribonuclease P protein component [Patescibacteria group bacterium]